MFRRGRLRFVPTRTQCSGAPAPARTSALARMWPDRRIIAGRSYPFFARFRGLYKISLPYDLVTFGKIESGIENHAHSGASKNASTNNGKFSGRLTLPAAPYRNAHTPEHNSTESVGRFPQQLEFDGEFLGEWGSNRPA